MNTSSTSAYKQELKLLKQEIIENIKKQNKEKMKKKSSKQKIRLRALYNNTHTVAR